MTMIVAAHEPRGTVRQKPTTARSKPKPTAELAASKPAPRVARVSDIAAARLAKQLNGEDQRVSKDVIANLPKGATDDFIVAPPNAPACESGWTGDRCAFPLGHGGEHSNDATPAQDRPRASRTSQDTPKPSRRASASPAKAKGAVERVPPAEVVALMAEHGVSRKALASALGVTVSRVSEMTTDRRPGSHVRRDRWPAVVKAAKAAAKARPMA